jgi:hypothetical protein
MFIDCHFNRVVFPTFLVALHEIHLKAVGGIKSWFVWARSLVQTFHFLAL